MDLIQVEHLGSCLKSVTSHDETVIQVGEASEEILDIIKGIKEELSKDNLQAYQVIKLEKRLAMLAAKIAIVKVGANSDIELKEKQIELKMLSAPLKPQSKKVLCLVEESLY
jgi:hypothetical protein